MDLIPVGLRTSLIFAFKKGFLMYCVERRNVIAQIASSVRPLSSKLKGLFLKRVDVRLIVEIVSEKILTGGGIIRSPQYRPGSTLVAS